MSGQATERAHQAGLYERTLEQVAGLVRAQSEHDRTITWCDGHGTVGLARNPAGHLEIFVTGPELVPRSPVVRESLEHEAWFRRDGVRIPANRLLLPAEGHFDQMAAFLCAELLRNGAATSTSNAFAKTEPLIALAIERLRMTQQELFGLYGELLVLLQLLRLVDASGVAQVVRSWKGHRATARDFQLGYVGVEVKATSGEASAHLVQGVHQVEPGHAVDDSEESSLLLVSIGLRAVDAASAGGLGAGASLPELVDSIIDEVRQRTGGSAPAVLEELIDHIAGYGSASGLGYQHRAMASTAAFAQPIAVTFVRCYDMADGRIQVLRTADLDRRPHVDRESVRFRIQLPERVRGDENPVVGPEAAAWHILSRR